MCHRRQTLSLTTVHSWKTGAICEVVSPQRQDNVGSSPLTLLLLNLRTGGLCKTEWVSKLNIQTELGLLVGSLHLQTMSELTKPSCINNSREKKLKLFSQKKEKMWCFVIELIGFNFKDNFFIARAPLVCGNIFYNCPIASIAQTAWIVNCGHKLCPPPFSAAKIFFHLKSKNIKFFNAKNMGDFNLFIEQDISDKK